MTSHLSHGVSDSRLVRSETHSVLSLILLTWCPLHITVLKITTAAAGASAQLTVTVFRRKGGSTRNARSGDDHWKGGLERVITDDREGEAVTDLPHVRWMAEVRYLR